MGSASDTLGRFGVDAERVARSAAQVQSVAAPLAVELPDLLAGAPDPALALANWEHLIGQRAELAALAALPPEDTAALFTLLGGSQSLATTLHAAGAGWVELFRHCHGAGPRGTADYEPELSALVGRPWEAFLDQLRHIRHRDYLRIGLADLTGRYAVETTMAELSALAEAAFRAASAWASHSLHEHYGCLPGAIAGVDPGVVVAMGKLGGRELNFSSDVDVMYLYEGDDDASGGGRRGTLDARQYFTRWAELITRALQEVTPAGFVFRVDLRLRPDGVNGPIINSVPNALLYYESYGQTWERTALIQARPIAGAQAIGERFLREIQPFVYRRYLDYATVADMKEMKARVEAELGDKARRGNVKLGPGGIREIEFVAQVLQLINGGREARLRGGGSLPTLERLIAQGYLPAEEGEELRDAYRFLRNVEHKIQIVQQRQTHMVPNERRDQETLARRLGYRGDDVVAQLWEDLDRHTGRVRRAFEKLFYEPAAETRRAGDAAMVQLVQTLENREATIARLCAIGFARPEASLDNLVLLRDGPSFARARAPRQKALYELLPALLGAILKSADPDLALQNMATFISSIGARTSFLALLRENPGTLRMLIELFGGSQFLANTFIRHPEQLDNLVRADLVRVHRTADDLTAELQASLRSAGDFEAALDVLRRFRKQEFLRVGINDLQALLGPEEVSAELTTLAETCLRSACAVADQELCRRAGDGGLVGRYVVLAMGKLGARELNYNSDLDLIFVYDDGGGMGALSAHEWFSKLAQRLITVLQTPTKEGIVYRIDTRLRPSGRAGPLVSALEAFREYHETSAQVWERQALIKARAVAGDASLGGRVEDIVAAFVYRAPLRPDEVEEIRRLRQRMERELARESPGRINIKTGRGGLVDIEFLTQLLQLHYGGRHVRVRVRDTLGALAALAATGVLSGDDCTLLTDGYRFLRRVEHVLRLTYDRPVEDLDRGQADVSAVARRMGFSGDPAAAGTAFWREYEVRRETIRACYERWLDRAAAGHLPAL